MADFPPNILLNIFSHLDVSTFHEVKRVNSRFAQLADSTNFYEKQFKNLEKFTALKIDNDQKHLIKVYNRDVSSGDTLERRLLCANYAQKVKAIVPKKFLSKEEEILVKMVDKQTDKLTSLSWKNLQKKVKISQPNFNSNLAQNLVSLPLPGGDYQKNFNFLPAHAYQRIPQNYEKMIANSSKNLKSVSTHACRKSKILYQMSRRNRFGRKFCPQFFFQNMTKDNLSEKFLLEL